MKPILFFMLMLSAPFAQAQSLSMQTKLRHGDAVKKVEAFLSARKLNTFAVIDHSRAAAEAGLKLPKSLVYIFGNPKAGTPLMEENPIWALHLPLRAAVYEDSKGRTFIAVTDIKAIAAKEKLSPAGMETIAKMEALLQELVNIK